MWVFMLSGLLAILLASPADARDRSREAAACVRRAVTTGLERYPPSRHDMPADQRERLGKVMDANNAKRAEQVRQCVSEVEARALGRLSHFLDVHAERCGYGWGAILRAPEDPYWGHVDLLNTVALGYLTSGPGRHEVGGAFEEGGSEARSLSNRPGGPPDSLCQTYWQDFGSGGAVFPGLLVRLPSAKRVRALTDKSRGADYLRASQSERLRWARHVAQLLRQTRFDETAMALTIYQCLEIGLKGAGNDRLELGGASLYCATTAVEGLGR